MSRAISFSPLLSCCCFIFFLLIVLWFWKASLSGRGGLPFVKTIQISVPCFFQDDPRWAGESLPTEGETIASHGCALTSAAMMLSFYGIEITPKLLNDYLKSHEGYEGSSWIRWESVASYPPGKLKKAYEGDPSYGLIDLNLLLGNPVIVRFAKTKIQNHFVIIVGKKGWDYLVLDPLSSKKGVPYLFSETNSLITGLRYFKKENPTTLKEKKYQLLSEE